MKKLLIGLMLCAGCALCLTGARGEVPPPEARRLVVYTAHKEDVYLPIIREFEARTGIWVSVLSGGTNEMLERLSFEEAAPLCDVMFGGGVESLDAYDRLFADPPADAAEAIRPEYRLADSHWVAFSALPMVLIYNTRLMGDDAPDSWSNLLDARFAGHIAFADPAVSGSSFTGLATLLQVIPGEDTLPRFVQTLQGRVLEGSGDVVTAVANGSCLIGVTLEETAMRAIAALKDIAMVYPKEGTSAVPDGAAIVKGCPHPENAQQFIRFILSEDVQRHLTTDLYRRPVHAGVPVLEPFTQDFPVAAYDIRWASSQKAELLRQWAECLAEGDA